MCQRFLLYTYIHAHIQSELNFLIDAAHPYKIKFLNVLLDNTQTDTPSSPFPNFGRFFPDRSLGEVLGIRKLPLESLHLGTRALTATQAPGSPHQSCWPQSHVLSARPPRQLNQWLRHCCFSPHLSFKFKDHRRTSVQWNLNYIWNSSCKGIREALPSSPESAVKERHQEELGKGAEQGNIPNLPPLLLT